MINAPSDSEIFNAASNGNINFFNQLINTNINVNVIDDEDESTPLMIAARKGHVEIIHLLNILGANIEAIDCYNNTALKIAVNYHQVDAVRVLIGLGAQVDEETLNVLQALPLAFYLNNKDLPETNLHFASLIDNNGRILLEQVTPVKKAKNSYALISYEPLLMGIFMVL